MKTKSLQIVLLCWLAPALFPIVAAAQSVPPVDCNCVLKLPDLQTNACQAFVPDLCLLATNCFSPSVIIGSPGYCSQIPAPGTPVGPGTTYISFTVVDSQGTMAQCLVPFVVTPAAGCAFTLICPTNKTVECGSTWTFDPPTWTNACVPPPGTPSNGVVLTIIGTVTNGTCPQVITVTWQGMDDCFYHDQCSQTVTVVDTTPPQLDCTCLTNNPVFPVPLTVYACTSTIPDLCIPARVCAYDACGLAGCTQTPPAGTVVGVGVYPITVTVYDCASNAASCVVDFTVNQPAGGCGTSGCVPPPTNMVAWWPLDELCGATIFGDASGNGNAALVLSGGPVCAPGSPNAVPGKVAGANYFYGLSIYGRAPNAPSLNFGTGSFSADGWVNPVFTGTTQWHPILDKLQQTGTGTGFGYKVGLLNTKVVLVVGNGTLFTNTSLGSINYAAWNFIAVSVDRVANTVTFHVNGVTEAPVPLTATGSFNSPVDLLVGGTWAVNIGYGELAVDELELFNRAITSAEMASLWQADSNGKCKPKSPCTNSVVSIFCPPDTNVETCTISAVVFYPLPFATTSCGTITNITCILPSGSTFPLGTNIVTCTATDSQGHTASCTFNVIVTPDRTPPSCPPTSISVTGCPPVMPDFATNGMVTDNCTPVGSINVVQFPTAGTVLAPGTTGASVVACDAASNCVQCAVTVTAVYSGTLPVITCPSNIVAKAYPWCTTNGTTVAYPPPQVSNGTLVSSTPPSGSFFPYGTTMVTCVATNACGTNQCTFTITVNYDLLIPPCTPPPANMVMWLKFDETSGASAANSSAGNSGLLANSPGHNLGQFVVNSLCFNGVNQYVQVTPYAAMQFGTNDFTVDAWVKPATFANTVRVIVDHREENGPVVRGYSLFLGGGNTVGFQIADGTFINYPFTSVVPADGQWHFVAVSVKRNDPLGIKLYVDGVADPNPRDPTIHPGSVTAGPCYPFRVASRSSSVSGLFPGCIDEVELFRRALAPSELQAIYDARCKGKCRISCQAGGFSAIPQCWLGHVITNAMVIVNPLPYPQTFNWSIVPLPVGPGCSKPGPTFSPSSGTVTIPGNYPAVLNTAVTLPPGFGVGDCSCWRMTISTPDGSQQATCDGSYCLPRTLSFCATPTDPLGQADNLDPGAVAFTLEGTGSAPTVLSNLMAVLHSPENVVVSAMLLQTLTVPPAGGGTVQAPATFAFPDYDPGRLYYVTLEADLDGTGQYTAVSSVPVINVVPTTDSDGPLTVQRGIGGTIIIKWPDPCGTIVVNPNLGNPNGWTPGPVQKSPWVFVPDPAAPTTFIRLQK